MFDIDIENTYAIGDSLNDLPMVEAVAHSACIGKDSLLAEHAQYVADDFYKDGLASSLKFFGLTD
jgi:hydroxymethylpyrimidine pyrophosphatase-like HAD family hydrolase